MHTSRRPEPSNRAGRFWRHLLQQPSSTARRRSANSSSVVRLKFMSPRRALSAGILALRRDGSPSCQIASAIRMRVSASPVRNPLPPVQKASGTKMPSALAKPSKMLLAVSASTPPLKTRPCRYSAPRNGWASPPVPFTQDAVGFVHVVDRVGLATTARRCVPIGGACRAKRIRR